MDIVYVNRDGENLELLYSLRSIFYVEYDQVWVFGGRPSWLNTDKVKLVRRNQNGSPYRSTRGHIAAACNTKEVSDPFLLMNDDFFAMRPWDTEVLNRGPLEDMLVKHENLKTLWAKGLRETASMLDASGLDQKLSYDLHAPLIIQKKEMREALKWAEKSRIDGIHVRTLYGNLARLGGTQIEDPKLMRRSDPFPKGPWLSSGDDTFRSTVEPVLRYTFPNPSIYERGL